MSKDFFRRPLGLALAGGGALSAWQTSVVHALEKKHGLAFDSIIGFSGGTLTGLSYCMSFTEGALTHWRATDGGILRPAPRLFPPSFCSDKVLYESVARACADEREAMAKARCRFVTISAPVSRDRHVYGVFSPGGKDGWDEPLARHVAASCSIPLVFPPVKVPYQGRRVTMVDGGVPCREPLSFDALGPCKDVIVIEMVRADEVGRRRGGLFAKIDQHGRETCRFLMGQGVGSLKRRAQPPRVFRLAPGRILETTMLDFSGAAIKACLDLGSKDADSFMHEPSRWVE